MQLTSTSEELALGEALRGLLERHASEDAVRRAMESEVGWEPTLWQRLASDLGVTGLGIPEGLGGAGGGLRDIGVVMREAGRSLLCAPYLSSIVLGAQTLSRCGDEAAAKELLPAVAAGKRRVTLAPFAADGSWQSDASTVTATGHSGGWRLSGTRPFVLDGSTAHDLIVPAMIDGEIALFLVDADQDAVSATPMNVLDQTRRQAIVELAGAEARQLDVARGVPQLLSDIHDRGLAALSAEQMGGAEKVLEQSVQYAKERVQFARPIGSLSAIKHRLADVHVTNEGALSASMYALECADSEDHADHEEFPLAAVLAASLAGDAFFAAASENIQVHGGIGFTWEHPAHLYFRRAKADQSLFASTREARELVAQRFPGGK